MAAAEKSGGSQTATVTTEHTLSTETDAGTYQAVVDLSNLAKGDVVEIRVKSMTRASGTTRQEMLWVFANAQTNPIFRSPPVLSPHEYVLTLKQTVGTGRAFVWAIQEP